MQLFAVNFILLPGYSTCFGRFTHPSSGVQFQLYLQPPVQIIVSYSYLLPAWPGTRPRWNKNDCKQLHLVGYLIEYVQTFHVTKKG